MSSCTSNLLPIDFSPGDDHIIIGRGRVTKMHSANVKFDDMIAAIATVYQAAPTKSQKGMLLSKLIIDIHTPSDHAGFVKRDPVTGRWHAVEESLARTTAAQAIRNYLSGDYRSSKQFKSKRRIQQIEQMKMMATPAALSGKTRCVSPYISDDESSSATTTKASTDTTTTSLDTFSVLFSAFGKQGAIPTEDPFEPTPLSETDLEFTALLSWELLPMLASEEHTTSLESNSADEWAASLIQSF